MYKWIVWVQVRQQILYVLQVLPSGRFVKVQALGPHCNDDDQLFLDMFQERERQWQQQRSQVFLQAHLRTVSYLHVA